MDRGLDLNLQGIMDRANGPNAQDRLNQSFNYPSLNTNPTEFSFEPAPRKLRQDPIPVNDFDRGSYGHGSSHQPLAALNSGPTRLYIGPRNAYSQPDKEPRVITNADNHFRFAQNLRQGLPVNQAPPRMNNTSNMLVQSPISQLANNMFLQRSMPQASPEPLNVFQGLRTNRLNQLQPQRQQITPPFNLSGFVYSPNQPAINSSPPSFQHSSPTTRVSLRRALNRATPASRYIEDEDPFYDGLEEPRALPGHAQRQTLPPMKANSKCMPQTLALGHAPPMAQGIQLVSPHELPDRLRQIFPYELFNAAQSKCFAPIYKSNDNVVVSAPTGSGKTALLELAICKLVEEHPSGQFKIVYLAPTKSLCSERMRDWQNKFNTLNLSCAELTGDTSYGEMNKVGTASIIVTTPEKWDSITRKWKDYAKLVQLVKLFLIDEVHILKDTRGATLEAVVSRMKSIGAAVRFVALSATVPNSQDIALWLGKNHTNTHLPAHRETFGEDFRPVKLQKHVYGFDGSMNDFAFEKVLDGKLPNLIQKHTHKKPIMVFCFTRKSCEQTAIMLAEWWTRHRAVERAWLAPSQRVVVGSKELQELVACGVAFHHAGLDAQDRNAIETAFLKGDISLICCTSTLAVGVNLPCHLVVLKGTVCFQDGALCEYSDLEVMQMLGRAGRPQFDDSAVAIIMTRSDKQQRYNKMISGQDILESTLHLNLIEHLNSEIGLGTVHDLYTAKAWLSGTFLSVRMRQNPNYYKLEGVPPSRDADERLGLVCERDVRLLQDNKLVTNKERFTCTQYGEAMSRYMVQFDTMRLLLSLPRHAKTEQVLHLLCQASEFKDLRIKPVERSSLREFNKSPFIKYPIKENISTTAHKISLMIQVQLGGVEPPTDKEFMVIRRQFTLEKSLIFERIQRLIRCIIECKAVDCDAISTRHALDFARSLSAEYWENSNLQLRQVAQVGPVAVRKLVSNNVNSVEKLFSLDTAAIERIMGKNPPFGRKMLDMLAGFPRLTLASDIIGRPTFKTGERLVVHVKARLGYENAKAPIWNCRRPPLTFTAETSDGTLVHFWRGSITKLDGGFDLKFVAELSSPDDEIKCYLACDEIVGTLRSCKIKPDVPAWAFPGPKPNPKVTVQTQLRDSNATAEDAYEFADDIDDDELLAAVQSVEVSPASDRGSDDFADIDDFDDMFGDIMSRRVKTEVVESVKMENGKWACNHHCRGSNVLKNGKPCKHRCCREGLDKPRKMKGKAISSTGTGELPPSLDQTLKSKSEKQVKGSQPIKNVAQVSGVNPRAGGIKQLASGGDVGTTMAKLRRTSQPTLKGAKYSGFDAQVVEVIDLAQQLSPVSYSKFAPREYRKLDNPDARVQHNKNVRLPKQKPQFSYVSGNEPNLPFLRKAKAEKANYLFDSGEYEEEESFPSPSALLRQEKDGSDPFASGMTTYREVDPTSSILDDSLESLETGMLGIDAIEMPISPTPNVDSSFANGVFDFEAFDGQHGDLERLSSPLIKVPRKRDLSCSPELPHLKLRRVTKAGPERIPSPLVRELDKKEQSCGLELSELEYRRAKGEEGVEKNLYQDIEQDTQQNFQQNSQKRLIPAWVDDFDSDFIEGLRDIVDFVD